MPTTVPMMEQLSYNFERALISLDRLIAKSILSEASPSLGSYQKIEQLVVPALERIGDGWEQGSVALSQVYMSGRLCEDLVSEILPPGDPQRINQPKMAIVALEDYHSLGKRIVYSALRAAGYDLTDYGHGVLPNDLVARTRDDRIQVLLISTLMLHSALHIKDVTSQFMMAQDRIKVVVGGAPFLFDDQLWREVGAHAMGRSAVDAIKAVRGVMGDRV